MDRDASRTDARRLGPLRWATCLRCALLLLLVLVTHQPLLARKTETALAAARLESLVRQASRAETYRLAPPSELKAAERLFARTMRAQESVDVLRQAWADLEFELEVHRGRAQTVWIVCESDERQTGRGFYAFRPERALPIALEAPHSFADKETRRLAADLFLGDRACAAAWNTVHRKIVDLAHADDSYLNAFTRAFVDVHRDQAIVCQLHGFAESKRTTAAGRGADLILSNGSRTPSYWLHHVGLQFRAASPPMVVRLYPNEVLELGGTTNQQARLLRTAGLGRFLHLEMSARLRKQLVSSPETRADYLKILVNMCRLYRLSAG